MTTRRRHRSVSALAAGLLVSACAGAPAATPPISPGTPALPREVNIIAREYEFLPPVVEFVPGESVVLHVINGGLEVHEAIIGDTAVQTAWESAEAEAANPPPGPTPMVSVPPEHAGLRVVVTSGQRVDVNWTVPADAASAGDYFVGCHIPGHWEKGMVVPVRFLEDGGD